MTNIHKAAREALETLRLARDRIVDEGGNGWVDLANRCDKDYMALRAALSEAPGEEREAFEAWKRQQGGLYMSRNNAPGSDLSGYQDGYTQGQWDAWQARAMLAARPEAPGESAARVQWLRELLDSVMDFRPEDGGMVRGGLYVRAESLLQAAEVAAARHSTPTVALTEADAMRLWHAATAAHGRVSAYAWFAAGIRAAENHHRIGKEGGA